MSKKVVEYFWDLLTIEESENEAFVEAWEDWCEYRHREVKKPVGPIAAKRQLRFLRNQPDPAAVINQSIMSGWLGLFPFKEPYRKPSPAETYSADLPDLDAL